MNSKEIAISTPNTIQNYDNYLKDYVNTSGFQWDSQCLDVAFKNLGNNFDKYFDKHFFLIIFFAIFNKLS